MTPLTRATTLVPVSPWAMSVPELTLSVTVRCSVVLGLLPRALVNQMRPSFSARNCCGIDSVGTLALIWAGALSWVVVLTFPPAAALASSTVRLVAAPL